MESPRIIFMGTPEFAVPTLEAIIQAGFEVVAVITAPDKPQGRGKKLGESPVKACAVQHNLPILQPTNLKDPAFIEELKTYRADLQVIVAFRMLPEVVWNMPPLGTYNLHGSLLPDYRGAAPINWAIINGEKETGVTTFKLQHEIDTGNILFQEKIPIGDNDNVGDIYTKLMHVGAQLMVRSLEAIQSGDYELKPQPDKIGKHAPKIFRETCAIDWNKPSHEVHNLIRGLSPYPAAWTTLDDTTLKIFATTISSGHEDQPDLESDALPGQLRTDAKTYLDVYTGDGWLSLLEIQLAGKKRMQTTEFLRGYTIKKLQLG